VLIGKNKERKMTERERLIELIKSAPKIPVTCGGRATGKTYHTAQNIADHLLSNNVFVAGYHSLDQIRVCDTCIHKKKHSYDISDNARAKMRLCWCNKFDNIMKTSDFCSYWADKN
jgi:hypothetical protein